jgi:hypothetical protein
MRACARARSETARAETTGIRGAPFFTACEAIFEVPAGDPTSRALPERRAVMMSARREP